jgi:hypothetical protein
MFTWQVTAAKALCISIRRKSLCKALANDPKHVLKALEVGTTMRKAESTLIGESR